MQVINTGTHVNQRAGKTSTYSLPNEVLLRIFEMGTVDEAPGHDVAFPVLVSHVSSHWRELSINDPALWTDLVVTNLLRDDGDPIERPEDEFPQTTHFLQRSKNRPFSICIDIRSQGFDNHAQLGGYQLTETGMVYRCHILAALLRDHIDRLRDFKLYSGTYNLNTAVLVGLQNLPMPCLESWEVVRCDVSPAFDIDFQPPEPAHSVQVFTMPEGTTIDSATFSQYMYPNLSHLTLSGVCLPWDLFAPCRLISLSISLLSFAARPSSQQFQQIMMGSQDTLKCLVLVGAAPFTQFEGERCTMTALEVLELGYLYGGELLELVRIVELPNVQSLELVDLQRRIYPTDPEVIAPEEVEATATVLNHLSLTFPLSQLKVLTMASVSVGEWYQGSPWALAVFAFFRKLTSVKHLRLYNPDDSTLLAIHHPYYEQSSDDTSVLQLATPSLDVVDLERIRYHTVGTFFQKHQHFQGSAIEKLYKPLSQVTICTVNGDRWSSAITVEEAMLVARSVVTVDSWHKVRALEWYEDSEGKKDISYMPYQPQEDVEMEDGWETD